MKDRKYLISTIVLAILLVGCIAYGFYYDATYVKNTNEKIQELNEYYEETYNDLLEKYNVLFAEHADCKKYKDFVDEYNAKQEEAALAEEARWNALSEEEQQLEIDWREYQNMTEYLKESNEEYKQLSYELSLMAVKGELEKDELKEYREKFDRRKEIEKEYKEANAADSE